MQVAVPVLGEPEDTVLRSELAAAGLDRRHELVEVVPPDVLGLFARHGLQVESMGRKAAEDPALFLAGAAAGALAADLAAAR